MASPQPRKAAASRADRHPYERIGPFQIEEEIGKGSFATVYKGYRVVSYNLGEASEGLTYKGTTPPSPVAVKAVTRNKLTPKLLDNLESEIRLLKGINHRNVVELVDCLKTDTHIYLIMAFSSAGDLSSYIRRRGLVAGLSIKDKSGHRRPISNEFPHPKEGGLHEVVVRSFLGQLADALEFLRSQNIIHRDIKPQNILLSPYPTSVAQIPECNPSQRHIPGVPILKVADFGFARFLPQASMAETLCGSPLYMAPEILRYEKYDAKADLWSAGAVLYEICTGRPPFRAQNHVELLRRIEKQEDRIKFPDERKDRPADDTEQPSSPVPITEVSPDLKAIIRRLLKRSPLERMAFSDFFIDAAKVAIGGLAAGYVPQAVTALDISSGPGNLEKANTAEAITRPSVPASSLTPANTIGDTSRGEDSGKAVLAVAATPHADKTKAGAPSPPLPSPRSSRDPSPPAVKKRRSSFAPKYIVGSIANVSPIADDLLPPSPQPQSVSNSSVGVKSRDFALRNDLKPRTTTEAEDLGASGGDSFLAREYVVVDKAPVQVNALADELVAASSKSQQQRPHTLGRAASKGFLTRQLSNNDHSPPSSPYPPVNMDLMSARPPPARAFSYTTSPLALANVAMATPSHAIAKAFNMASLKLFGNPKDGLVIRRPSAARKIVPRFTASQSDAAETRLVTELEDLGQRALVIFDFADHKMHLVVTASSSAGRMGTSAYDANPFEPPSGSSTSATNDSVLAAEALVLYLRSLAFLQAAIRKAKAFWDARQSDASLDFNEAVQWLRTKFNECYEKAEFARGRLGENELPETAVFGEKLIYDRALEMARAAAVNELKGDQPRECEIAYETALYLLYGMIDDIPDIDPAKAEDVVKIKNFIASIQARLAALRKKMLH